MESHVPFKPGSKRPAGSGAQKGAVKRDELSCRHYLREKDIILMEDILREIAQVTDHEAKAKLLISLMPYCYPRLSAIEVQQKTEIQMKLEAMTPQEIMAEAKRLLLTKGETIDGEFTTNGNGQDKEGISNALHNSGGDLTTTGRLAVEITRDQEED